MKYLIVLVLLFSCASSENKKTPLQKKAEIHYNQGTQEMVGKDYTSAIKNLIEANRLSPDDTRILNNLGMAYYFKESTDRAVRYIKRAIEVDPKNTDARLNLATILTNKKQFNAAEKQFKIILDDLTYPKQQRTHYNLGLLYLKNKRVNKARDQFKKSLAVDDTYCPASFQLGILDFKNKTYDAAYRNFRDASLGTCYKLPEPQYYQALSLLKMGNTSLAQLKFEEVIDRFSRTIYAKKAMKYMDNFSKFISINNKKTRTNTRKKSVSSPQF